MNIGYLIIFLCCCLLAFMLYKEWSRPKKVRLAFRILASVLTVIAIAFLWFPIKYHSSQIIKQNELVLVTEGTDLEILKAEKSIFYTADSSVLNQFKSEKIKFIPSLSYHLATEKNINNVRILGYGLEESELKKLENYKVIYQKSALPNGIQACSWQDEVFSGEEFKVQGTYQNSTPEKVKLVLKGLGTSLDSITIQPNSLQEFNLGVKPKQVGKSVYQLFAVDGKDTLQNESLAFKVNEKQNLRFLILAATPDFEYKFLKNWLFENGYAVVFRSQISKNIYSYDYLNTPKFNIKQILSKNLKEFDVIIADDVALANLSNSEIAVLQNQISKNGLGLLIRSTEAKSLSKLSDKFGYNEFPTKKVEQLKLKLQNEDFVFSPLQIKQDFYLKKSSGSQTLIADDTKQPMVLKRLSGNGKVVLNAVSSTFQWMLNGKNVDYGKFWSGLINQISKPKDKPFQVSLSSGFATQGYYLTINLSQSGNQIPKLNVAEISLKPLQNKVFPYQFQATYLSEKAGWHQLNINQKDSFDFYVYKPNAWLTIKQTNKVIATAAFVNAQKQKDFENKILLNQKEREISRWWFLFVLLVSVGYLWYEERMVS